MFRKYQGIGLEEKQAVLEVMDSGVLSGFVAGPPDCRDVPNGGPKVRELEEAWAKKYGVKHALTFNSATTALMAACKAVGVSQGDRVITTPWTMSATPAAALHCGAVIDFADIEEDNFCIDPYQVQMCYERGPDDAETRAVMAVNLFGHTAKLWELRDICNHFEMALIEDCAQTPLATEDGQRSGTVGDIGVYSLNRHKHIHCGEGGVAVTDDDEIARKMRSVRNHGVDPVGLNLRMTEIEAAIALVQLKNIDVHVEARRKLGQTLSNELRDVMEVPHVREGCEHDYYFWVAKAKLKKELKIPHIKGYIQPLHKIFGGGDCPVVERMREETIGFETCKYDPTDSELDQIIEAFREAV